MKSFRLIQFSDAENRPSGFHPNERTREDGDPAGRPLRYLADASDLGLAVGEVHREIEVDFPTKDGVDATFRFHIVFTKIVDGSVLWWDYEYPKTVPTDSVLFAGIRIFND